MRRSWAARRTRKLSLSMWPFRFHLILRILGVQKRPPKRAKFLKRPPILPFPFPRKTGSPKRWPYLPNRRPKKAKKRARTSRRDPLHHPISLKNQWVFDVFKNKEEKRSMDSIFSQVAAQRPRKDEFGYPGGSQGGPISDDIFSKMGPGQASENRHFPDLTGTGPKHPNRQKVTGSTRFCRAIWP